MPAQLLIDTAEIGIVTTNMEAMRDFYENVVGLPYQEKMEFVGGHMHRYKMGGAVLKLVQYDTAPAATGVMGNAMAATGYRYSTLVIGNMKEFVEEVKQAGHKVATDITDFGGGIGFVFIEDPDGNWLELAGPTG